MIWLLAMLLSVFVVVPIEVSACMQYRDVIHDRNGNVLAGVAITVRRHGNANAATIYSDDGCTSVLGNPLSSSGTGEFSFFAADGQYDLSYSKSGYTFVPAQNIGIYAPLGENVKLLSEFTTDDLCEATNGAIDQIGATVTTLMVNRAATCSVTKTSPATLTIVGMGKGDVTTNTPNVLTVNGPVRILTGQTFWKGTGTYAFGSAAGSNPFGMDNGIISPIYGASITVDAALGETFVITATNNSNFTINTPTNATTNKIMRVTIKNTSGGALGTATWGGGYKLAGAWTQPANAKNRTITFYYNGSNWAEVSRSAADVDN